MSTLDTKKLLNIGNYLNSLLFNGNNTYLSSKIETNTYNINAQNAILEDLKDAIATYNREYIELENSLTNKPTPSKFSTLQDWSLLIFFTGFASFSLAVFIYIISYSRIPIILGISYLFLNMILYTFIVFIIQRYG